MTNHNDDAFWDDVKAMVGVLQRQKCTPAQAAQLLIGSLAFLTGMNARESSTTLDDFLNVPEVKELIATGLKLGHGHRPG